MRVDEAAKEIILKVVYYGPGMAGKTTNLTIIHDRVPSNAAGDLQVVDTHSERTLRFDLLGVDVGQMLGHNLRFDFFTVPGQSYYAATRRAVLAGTDGVVFVADSRREALDENIEAMNEMLNSLRHHGLPEDLPVVLQYNKQDLPTALKPEQLEPLLNIRGWPSRSSVARDGTGVMETMQDITRMTRDWAMTSDNLPADPAVPVLIKAEPPVTWLISCYRCQAMLEVPDAKVGALYACGVCSSQLEVYDSERGLTRAPASAPKPTTARVTRDDSDYGLQTISDQKSSALGNTGNAGNQGQRPAVGGAGTPFEIPGYDLIDLLDENPLARRSRVRERATGRILRALSVNPVLLRQPGYFDAFEPHVRLASQVKHPYILPLAAMHANKDVAVLFSHEATDYEHLGHVLARRRALAPPHAMGILRQIALALEEAARHGVVHGWLRPEIVLVNPEGSVFVDELAFPKNHRFLIRELSGASAATEYYLAPEHINGESRSDVRSDIFMLGSLLFRMFTGEGLVTGYNAHEALHKIVANGARSLRSVQTGISRDLETFYQRLVTTERKDRYQSYRELIDALDQFGGGAKRQTMRLTQSVNTGPGPIPGTGTHRRTVTGQIGRPGTTEFPRGLGTVSTSTHRAQIRPPDYTTTMTRKRKPDRSGAIIAWVMLIALAVAGGLIALVFYPQHGEPLPDDKTQPSNTSGGDTQPRAHEDPPTHPTGTVTDPQTHKPQPVVVKDPPVTAPPLVTPTPVPTNGSPVDGSPTTQPAVVKGDERERVGVVMQIATLEREHLFKQAMEMCDHMPTAEERQAKILHVVAMHDAAKREIESLITANKNINEIAALLLPVRESWLLGDDAEWAAAQLASATTRLGSAPTPPPPAQPIPDPVKPVTTPTPVPPVQPPPPVIVAPTPTANTPERVSAITLQILNALGVVNLPAAQQASTELVAGSPEDVAIKRLIEVWNKRGDIIGRVMTARAPKLRVSHPATKDLWEITQAGPTGLTVATLEGSSSSLSWNQVQLADLARVCEEMSSAPTAKPEEHELAVVMHLINKDSVLARTQLRKAKANFDTQAIADYEVLISQQNRRDALDLVVRANAAAASGNTRLLTGLIDQLKHVDRNLESLVAADIARLSGQETPHPGSGAEDASSKDHLLFKNQEDVNAFTEHGGWQMAGGGLSNVADGAKLMRHDLKDARTANVIFQQSSQRGSLMVEFRGVRVIIDFTTNSYVVRSHDEELKARPLTVLAKATNSLYFEVKQPNNMVNIDFNNGVDSVSIKGGDLADTFALSTSSGAQISVQELQITRSAATGKSEKPDGKADKQQEIHDLGLDPLGGAYLDNPLIVLPATTGGINEASGIAVLVRENIVGATFECKGTGTMRVQFGNPADRTTGDWIDVPVHAIASSYKVTWTPALMTVTDASGTTLGSKAINGVHGYFILSALHEATLMKTPVMIHQ